MSEIYISIDVETSGPVPGLFSMLSLGAAAFDSEGQMVDTFYEKLQPLGDAHEWDDDTLRWWSQFPDQLKEALNCARPASEVMGDFVGWCHKLTGSGKVTLVASPAGFDGMFVNWYAVWAGIGGFDRFPWKHRVLDLRSFAAAKLGIPYHEAHNSTVCKAIGFKPSVAHDHNALSDAIEQGETFMALLAFDRKVPV